MYLCGPYGIFSLYRNQSFHLFFKKYIFSLYAVEDKSETVNSLSVNCCSLWELQTPFPINLIEVLTSVPNYDILNASINYLIADPFSKWDGKDWDFKCTCEKVSEGREVSEREKYKDQEMDGGGRERG